MFKLGIKLSKFEKNMIRRYTDRKVIDYLYINFIDDGDVESGPQGLALCQEVNIDYAMVFKTIESILSWVKDECIFGRDGRCYILESSNGKDYKEVAYINKSYEVISLD